MDSSNQDSFYVTLTSDKGYAKKEEFQDSDFSVQLSHEIRLDSNDWEVGLASFTYPFDFNTVGSNNLILLRYRDFIHEIKIPVWNCTSIDQMTQYLDVEMNKKVLHGKRKADSKTRPVQVEVDTYKRVRFSFDTEDIDIGFADHTGDMLGFKDRKDLTIQNFQTRQRLRELVKSMVKKGEKLDITAQEQLQQKNLENPDNIYSIYFFDEFLYTFGKEFQNPNPWDGPKQALFRKLTEGVENPFEASLDNEVPMMDDPNSRPGLKLAIHSEDITIGILENLETSFEGSKKRRNVSNNKNLNAFEIRKHHLDWFQKTKYQDLFTFNDIDLFIERFEENLDVKKRTFYNSSTGELSYSGLYTEAIAAFICAQYLKDFKLQSAYLYSDEPAVLNPYELMYIYLDIIKPEPFNSMMAPLLEIIRTSGIPGSITQYRPKGHLQYKKLVTTSLTNLRILIASRYGSPVPFLRGPTEIQLHFKRREKRNFH
jgi:hypothetical protein